MEKLESSFLEQFHPILSFSLPINLSYQQFRTNPIGQIGQGHTGHVIDDHSIIRLSKDLGIINCI